MGLKNDYFSYNHLIWALFEALSTKNWEFTKIDILT